jgi:hypothetical protein
VCGKVRSPGSVAQEAAFEQTPAADLTAPGRKCAHNIPPFRAHCGQGLPGCSAILLQQSLSRRLHDAGKQLRCALLLRIKFS